MKFVHIADMHFDMPFTLLSNRADLGEIRRVDQRRAFQKIIEYIKENQIPYLFIAGDFYEQEYIRESTINYISNCIEQIPDTHIFITPGNHDPYLKNSYYKTFSWPKNVTIFGGQVEKIEMPECDVYGFGFTDFECTNSGVEEISIENSEKINILITHANLDGSKFSPKNYQALSSKKLEQLGFDYIALGHIHKSNLENKNQRIVYPGSTISMGFDELGKHGMVVGNITKENVELEFIPIDEKEFEEKNVDISEMNTLEELLEYFQTIFLEENKYYKINLIGNRNFEINLYSLYKKIENKNIIKIKNRTNLKYSLEEMANDTTLKGIFVTEMLKKLKEENADKEIIEKALEYGLDVLS